MKLDVNVLRYLSKDEFRVLVAVEMGMRNHEIVPAVLVEQIASLKRGGAFKCIRDLLRNKLVHHESKNYDGYRLTNLGYDFLAIHALSSRGLITALGRQIGVGKESDIFEAVGADGRLCVLKLHRLGRTSFRAVKAKRDYLQHRTTHSWLYLSRLAALKEYAFLKALGENGFPVPAAIDCNRHCVLMELVDAVPLVQVRELLNPGVTFSTVLGLVVRLAQLGLIHCDFNEFNLLIDEEERVTMIDFPQMVSVAHKNAEMYFDRDVECIFKFFGKRFNYAPPVPPVGEGEEEEDGRPDFDDVAGAAGSLDRQLAASGFSKGEAATLDRFAEENGEESGEESGEEGEEEGEGGEVEEEGGDGREAGGVPGLGAGEEGDGSLRSASVEWGCPGREEGVDGERRCGGAGEAGSEEEARGCEDESVNGSVVAASLSEHFEQHGERSGKKLEKVRNRAAAAVKGGRGGVSRNSSKDKGGKRSKASTREKIEY